MASLSRPAPNNHFIKSFSQFIKASPNGNFIKGFSQFIKASSNQKGRPPLVTSVFWPKFGCFAGFFGQNPKINWSL